MAFAAPLPSDPLAYLQIALLSPHFHMACARIRSASVIGIFSASDDLPPA
ncbi:unnamed protein product [Mycena citricolor]|uniref:Uncharacterized protein n=1 Tax=Mycena citricolor TaxID=2018698 RepID=A0AAD2Q344_9AGAR|nr:unnamed protein product [Mycena citricolor]